MSEWGDVYPRTAVSVY